MAYLYSLCSSSKGNSTYLGDQKSGILIDAGIGIREFTRHMQLQGFESDTIKAIFITHEHSDHVKGLTAISKKLNVPIFGSRETLEQLIEKEIVSENCDLNEINKRSVCIGDMEITAFATPHDSAHSQGYQINIDQKRICVCTDLGTVSDEVYANLKGSDFILLESNYDEGMLHNGEYPAFLKKRILGDYGHLSNEMCSKTLTRLLNDGTARFLLGHLSQNNNRPELALQSALYELISIGAVLNKDYQLTVAPVKSIGEIIQL